MSFEEANKTLSTRQIEDNHYSWMFAIGNISNRDDYYTYTKHMNQRKEGMRYAN